MGQHDENISEAEAGRRLGVDTIRRLKEIALEIYRRWRTHPERLHLLWWALGVATYGAGTFTEAWTTLFGWNQVIFKAWYITGALLGGAPLAQCMAVRALELDGNLGRQGPRIVVLTIGSITPAVAFHPRALKMRETIRRLAIEPSINWIECQSRKDALNFWGFDPVAGIGIQLGPERCNPLVWQVRFRDMLSPQFYRKLRWKLFRLHFQYIMANQMRAPYDFFMLIGSPVPIMEWAKRQRDVVAEFSPEGEYLGA